MKVVKKPVTVDAWHIPDLIGDTVKDSTGDPQEVPHWVLVALARGVLVLSHEGVHRIATEQGLCTAVGGDWLMRGVEGEIYPCSDSVFAKTYEFEAPKASVKRHYD